MIRILSPVERLDGLPDEIVLVNSDDFFVQQDISGFLGELGNLQQPFST